jgi:serine/threonine-protein kinase RsbW
LSHPAPASDALELPARFGAIAETAKFALTFCERHGIGRQRALQLRLVIEELFSNSIQHGYCGECDTPIRIALAMIDGYLTLQYEDSAPPYDPLARLSTMPAHLLTPLDARPTDGLGLYLVGKLAYGARYEYEDGHNRLWLVMPP